MLFCQTEKGLKNIKIPLLKMDSRLPIHHQMGVCKTPTQNSLTQANKTKPRRDSEGKISTLIWPLYPVSLKKCTYLTLQKH